MPDESSPRVGQDVRRCCVALLLAMLAMLALGCGDDALTAFLKHDCQNWLTVATTHADTIAALRHKPETGGASYPECAFYLDSLRKP